MPAPKRKQPAKGGRGRQAKPKAKRPARRPASSDRPVFAWLLMGVGALLVVFGLVCLWNVLWTSWTDSEDEQEGRTVEVLTTGYCNCEKCCSWTTNEQGVAVYSYGRMKGRPKVVGQTCTGRKAHRGTIAADPSLFRFGTKIIVPDYGPGIVDDIGGAIKGKHIDLWFPTHQEALEWGRRTLTVTVYEE